MSLLKRFLWERWYAHFIKLKITQWCLMILEMKSKSVNPNVEDSPWSGPFTILWFISCPFLHHSWGFSPPGHHFVPFVCGDTPFVWNVFSPLYLHMASHFLIPLPQFILPPPLRGRLRPLIIPTLFISYMAPLFPQFISSFISSFNYVSKCSRGLLYFIYRWSTLPDLTCSKQVN